MVAYFIFPNIRTVIQAEAYCKAASLAYVIRPVPSHLSSDCGMCIELREPPESLSELLQAHAIPHVLHKSITSE